MPVRLPWSADRPRPPSPAPRPAPRLAPRPAAPSIIELAGVAKAYREGERRREVFRDVDLRIDHGAFVVVLGPSGSGKSTLLNLCSGIDQPDAGRVIIDGHDLTRLSETDRTLFRRRHIGFVFQFFNLVPTLTVIENLLLPLELNGRTGADEQAVAHELLAQVGLADRADTFPDRLSGGEQQRVAVVRALVHQPDLVLADEPTGNLDETTGAGVLRTLHRLSREAGRTVVMVTHNPDYAHLADRLLHVEHGGLTDLPLPERGAAG